MWGRRREAGSSLSSSRSRARALSPSHSSLVSRHHLPVTTAEFVTLARHNCRVRDTCPSQLEVVGTFRQESRNYGHLRRNQESLDRGHSLPPPLTHPTHPLPSPPLSLAPSLPSTLPSSPSLSVSLAFLSLPLPLSLSLRRSLPPSVSVFGTSGPCDSN